MTTSVNTLSFLTGFINVRLFHTLPFEQRAEMSRCRIAARKNRSIFQEFAWTYAGTLTLFAILIYPLIQIFQSSEDSMIIWAVIAVITQLMWTIIQLPFVGRWVYKQSLELKTSSP